MVKNFQVTLPVETPAVVTVERRQNRLRVIFTGDWTISEVSHMDLELARINLGNAREVEIDGSNVGAMDSAGAWLLLRTKREAENAGAKVTLTVPEKYQALLDTMERDHTAPPVTHPPHRGMMGLLERTGEGTMLVLRQGYDLLGFLGRVTIETVEALLAPKRELPFTALVHQIEETGVTALPIVGLLAFLLGVVLAYQGADQLKRFGAQIYTIDFLGVGFLRELGGLVTAIIIAGRSGSAFTAQIGTMRVNEEIDAMQTIGLNIAEVLVLPRVLGLVIALPILTLFADVVGIIGGLVMTYFDLGITIPAFMRELKGAINMNTLMVGIIKAPVFAFTIALVGCFEGMRVERNAASVGKLTTRSVVESIFLIIAIDAAFSILFSVLGI
ncbi:MAG TPA: MlaE family lipid ABC transporter permease subunit [Rhizomicrobium sp.]|nr:MlaE family lipid ABC transporter permease subunit [Rhizomicrobium sp.]